MRKGVQTATNGSAQKSTWQKGSGDAIVRILVASLKRGAPPILTKTWYSVCFLVSNGSDEWVSLYKIRTSVERSINHFKTNMCVAEEYPQPCHHEIGCFSCRDCQPADCHCCTQYELSTIYPEPETFNCLKRHSIVIVLL